MFYFLIVNKACPVTISNCPSKFAPPQRNIIHPLQAVHGVSCNFSDKIITSSLLQENRCDTILIASSSEMIHLTHFLMTHLSLSWVLVKKYGNSCFYYLLQKNKFTVKEFFFVLTPVQLWTIHDGNYWLQFLMQDISLFCLTLSTTKIK